VNNLTTFTAGTAFERSNELLTGGKEAVP